MFTISLNNLQFHSYHGIYEEEKLLGSSFEVNVELTIDGQDNVLKMDQTINYESVYAITAQRMAIPTALLETVAQDLANLLHEADKRTRSAKVSIQKKNPPFATIQGAVGVSYQKEF